MNYFTLFAVLGLSAARLQAQDSSRVVTNFKDTVSVVHKDTTYWQKSFSGGINYNQASFSNWSGGGVNSVALGSLIAARALYVKGRTSWDNTADLQLGYVRQGGLMRKSTDQIVLNSIVGHKLAPRWDLFGSVNFTTFFAPGFRYDAIGAGDTRLKVSNFFAPAQLVLAGGISYKPIEWFSLRLSPVSPRLTFVLDKEVRVTKGADGIYRYDPAAVVYGVKAGRTVRLEWLAFQLQAALTRNLTSNISVNAHYQIYANYQELTRINHRLDLLVTAKVSRYISTTFGLIALYNKDFSDALQVQQSLAIGLLYNVSTFRKKDAAAPAK